MKRTTKKLMAGTVALACLTLGAGGLHAQVTQVLTVKTTASVQGGYSTSTNSHTGILTYTYATPTKHSVATKDLLALLALDENAEGNYPGTNFPSGAKLVMTPVTPDPDGGSFTVTPVPMINNSSPFQVVDKNNNTLVGVSDIISINSAGSNVITSSKSTSSNPSLGTSTDLELLSIKFDDTGAGGSLKFFLSGIWTSKITDTTPQKTTGAYTESISGSLSSGTGEGSYQGNPFVCTGTASESGKATLNINNSVGSPGGDPGGITITTH
jgi:hypothetical protein